jgi:hypothetical protein
MSELKNRKNQEIKPVMVVPASSSDIYPFAGKVKCDELLVGSGTDTFGVAGEQRKMLKLTDSSFVNGGIVIGGGVGTMLESLGCYHNGIPVAVLKNSGWAAGQLQNLVSEDHFINDGKMLGWENVS